MTKTIIKIIFLVLFVSCANDINKDMNSSVVSGTKSEVQSTDIKFVNTSINDGDTFMLAMGGSNDVITSYAKFEQSMITFDKISSNYSYSGMYRLFGGGSDPSSFDVLETLHGRTGLLHDSTNLESPQIFELMHSGRLIKGVVRHNYLEDVMEFNYDNLAASLNDIAIKAKANDKVRLFWIGNSDQEGHLQLRDQCFSVEKLTNKLNDFNKDTQVQLLISQGYGRMYSMLNYTDGDFAKGITEYNRCAFLDYSLSENARSASIYNLRDIWDEKVYVDYFFAAYDDKKAEADYNHDEVVGANEAHAFALINVDNYYYYVDTLTTSAGLLSHFYQDKSIDELLDSIAKITPSANYSWMDLLEELDPAEKALFLAIKNKLEKTIAIDDNRGIADIVVNLSDINDRRYANYIANYKISESSLLRLYQDNMEILDSNIGDVSSRGKMPALTAYEPVDFFVSGDVDVKRDEMMEMAQDYFENHEKFNMFKDQLTVLSKFSAEFRQLSDDYSNLAGLMVFFRNQIVTKLQELYLKKVDQQNPIYQKYMQLKACEAASFFN